MLSYPFCVAILFFLKFVRNVQSTNPYWNDVYGCAHGIHGQHYAYCHSDERKAEVVCEWIQDGFEFQFIKATFASKTFAEFKVCHWNDEPCNDKACYDDSQQLQEHVTSAWEDVC